MTYAAVPALRVDESLAKEWTPALAATTYDPGIRPVAEKAGALAGMGMTEKQGGSDVRANVTEATAHRRRGRVHAARPQVVHLRADERRLPRAGAGAEGLSCFVVPRALPDGSRNRLDVVRLKDKLGNRSNASSEIELDGTLARRLGDEGRGVRTIIEMVAATRLDCVLGSASLMRHALAEASWHVAHRSAFGSLLADKPLMQNVVADLAVESEAATALAIRLAAAVDRIDDPHEAALRRIALPLAKFWVCKRTPGFVAEALECLGGNGYVEDSGLPLLYREAPLNSVWEGSGNVNALDVLRALAREPEVLAAWITEVGHARGADARLDRAVDDILTLLGDEGSQEAGPAGWPGGWPRACRARCSCASRRPRWPTRSAARGSARRTTARTARSRRPRPSCRTIVAQDHAHPLTRGQPGPTAQLGHHLLERREPALARPRRRTRPRSARGRRTRRP